LWKKRFAPSNKTEISKIVPQIFEDFCFIATRAAFDTPFKRGCGKGVLLRAMRQKFRKLFLKFLRIFVLLQRELLLTHRLK